MFPRIGRSHSLRKEVANYIVQLIKNGTLKPGDRLPTEREMAEKFGVSRTVIRDAVKTLSGVGVLKVKHGIGIFVATADDRTIARQLSTLLINDSDTIENLFEVRMVLETAAAGWAAERVNDKELVNIKGFISLSEKLMENKIDIEEYKQNDQDFHLLITKMSKNPLALRLMKSMLDLLAENRKIAQSIPGRARSSVKEHIKILEAIYNRQSAEASNLMEEHLTSVLESIKQRRIHNP